jgi:3-hydroxyisobutyrate dehydrogenase
VGQKRPEVGFIGVGNMGSRIVELLLQDDHHVNVWARREASLEPFAGRIRITDDPVEVGRRSDLVGICVWDENDVSEILVGEQGVFAGLGPGGVVAIHSTIGPAVCRALAVEAASIGVHLVDAPVSYRGPGRKLLLMLGGEVSVIDAFSSVFRSVGDPAIRVGPQGSGQVAKLVHNTMLAATVGLGADALGLGVDLGLDHAAFLEVLSAGSAGGTWTSLLRSQLYGRTDEPGGRTNEWIRKDVDLTRELAGQVAADQDRDVLRLATRAAEA